MRSAGTWSQLMRESSCGLHRSAQPQFFVFHHGIDGAERFQFLTVEAVLEIFDPTVGDHLRGQSTSIESHAKNGVLGLMGWFGGWAVNEGLVLGPSGHRMHDKPQSACSSPAFLV